MSGAIYVTLTRQQGLMNEMQAVAHNLANASTTGYKADRAIFSELVLPTGTGQDSVSAGALGGHAFDLQQAPLHFTQGRLDLAIQGEGFFRVQTADGERFTRAGHFQRSAEGELVTVDGARVLNASGGAITLPENAGQILISEDGTIAADGEAIGQIGLFLPRGSLQREGGSLFVAPDGAVPAPSARLVQGALENSNVSAVLEVSRMVEVQRAYEAGQSLLEREDERLSKLISAIRDR